MKHRVLFAGLLCAAVACQEGSPVGPDEASIGPVADGAVRLVIQQDRSVTGDSAVFVVRVVGRGVALAAYQGVVTFTPGTMQVLALRTPDVAGGEFRIVNDADVAAGRIRFAAFAPEAIAGTEAFRIVARVTGGLSALKLTGTLDVAGETQGQSVALDRLERSEGVYEAATNIRLDP